VCVAEDGLPLYSWPCAPAWDATASGQPRCGLHAFAVPLTAHDRRVPPIPSLNSLTRRHAAAASLLFWEVYNPFGHSRTRVMLTIHNLDNTGAP
jgi:hypothetical protein